MDSITKNIYEAMLEISIISLTSTNDAYIMERELRRIDELEELLNDYS